MVFGCWTNASRNAVRPIFEQLNGLLFYPTYYEGLENSPNIVYTGSDASQQIVPTMEYLLNEGYKKFFVIGHDRTYSRAINHIIKAQALDRGAIVNGEEYIDPESEWTEIFELIKFVDPDIIISTLSGDTNQEFFRAFNSEEITSLKMSLALEQFMHSIVSHNSKFDKSQRLEVALTPSERRGRVLFFQEFNGPVPSASGADCAHCHSGSNFENDLYMNNGLDTDATISDSGRYAATGINGDIGKFKVPTLRNIELTPPYMHDGRFKTLEEVVDHYDHGIKVSTTLDPALNSTITTGLRLTAQDKIDLVAFLKTLTDEDLISDKRYSSPF